MTAKAKKIGAIQVSEDMLNRKKLAGVLGSSYNGNRNLYTVLGYPTEIKFEDYWARYKRQDIASALINRPVKYTWKGEPVIHNPESADDVLKNAWKELYTRLKLAQRFRAVDILSGIGEYAVLLLGFDDVEVITDFTKPVEGTQRKLLYVQAFSQSAAKINRYDANPNSERYGMPFLYDITTGTEGGDSQSIQVHYSRIIHVIGEGLTSDVVGTPVMESVFNRLMDIEKLSGGSGEMFWRGARPGYSAEVKEGYEADDDLQTALENKIKNYEDNQTRFIVIEGAQIQDLAMQVADPTPHLNIQVDLISAAKAIPKRILMGSERGELSSSQDADSWADIVDERREAIAEPQILKPFVDMCMKFGILPKQGYDIEWVSLHQTSDKDKAEIGRIRAAALQAYVANPAASEMMPPEAFMKFLLGLTAEQIEEVLSMIAANAFEVEEQEVIEQQPNIETE